MRFLSLILAGGLFLSSDVSGADSPADGDGFVPLFNGRDLNGWINVNGATENWTVRDGMIHCDGVPTGALRTVKQYENFIMEAEWRHVKPGGNAGIFIWAGPLPSQGTPFLRSIEVQVLDHAYGTSDWFTTHGDVFAIHGAVMKPFPPSKGMRSFPIENRSKGSPEWNHYRITCQDGTIRLAVNGKDVSGGSDCVWRKGYIGLESEGSPVDWRNLKVRELPGGKATAEQTAPLAQTTTCLYDGRSLQGWTVTTDPPGGESQAWVPKDWTLACTKAGAALRRTLPEGPGVLSFDYQGQGTKGEPATPLVLRAGKLTLKVVPEPGWHRFSVRKEPGKLSVIEADRSVAEVKREPAGPEDAGREGEIEIIPGGPCQLANLYWITGSPAPAGTADP